MAIIDISSAESNRRIRPIPQVPPDRRPGYPTTRILHSLHSIVKGYDVRYEFAFAAWEGAMKAMITRASFTLNCLISVLAVVPAMAAPGELYGKSVVVSWSENREESARGSSEKRQLTASQSLSVYVSSTGRLFSRREATGRFTDG